jgi:hypothetical protein
VQKVQRNRAVENRSEKIAARKIELILHAGLPRSRRCAVHTIASDDVVEFGMQVVAPGVKGKGFDQVASQTLASEFLTTGRAAGISALLNIDSQHGFVF